MKLVLLSVFVVICQFGYSQKSLTLIIDTVSIIDDEACGFHIFLTNQGFAELGEIVHTDRLSSSHPNFQVTCTLQSDSTDIHIPLNCDDGYLKLKNAYGKDTIWINNFQQLPNCYEDTVKTWTSYYKMRKGEIPPTPYSTDFKQDVVKKDCEPWIGGERVYSINEEEYRASEVKTKNELSEVINGHGYKPRWRGRKKRRGTYFHIRTVTESSINTITIELK